MARKENSRHTCPPGAFFLGFLGKARWGSRQGEVDAFVQVFARRHTVWWDGRSDRGEEMASGVYFYRLLSGEREERRSMVLIR